jgi:hypothetical protein
MNEPLTVTASAALPREHSCQMRGSELVLMDTTKAMLEILMATQIIDVDTIEMMLLARSAKCVPWREPDAQAVLNLLLTFLRDPRRREHRERLRSVLQESAKLAGQNRGGELRGLSAVMEIQ